MVACGLALLVSPVLSTGWYPNRYEGGRSKDERSVHLRNSSATAQIAGELRATFSDIIFIKTERYLHAGVAYAPHMNLEKDISISAARADVAEAHDEHGHGEAHAHEHHGPEGYTKDASHAGTETAIKPPDEDFRGFVGNLHRAVSTYRDPSLAHMHSDGREMLPWFRVATLSNPNFVRGYCVGAWWLKLRNPAEAIAFAREGIANNPDAFQIHLVLGELYLDRVRELSGGVIQPASPEALEAVEQARQAYREAARLAMAQRPADFDALPEYDPWREWMDTDAMRATEMAVLLEVRFGDEAAGRALAREYLRVYPQSGPLRRQAGGS